MSSQLGLVRENDRELVFAYPYHVAAWFGVLLGGGMFYLAFLTHDIGGAAFGRWFVGIFGLVVALGGLASGLHFDRLTLDRMARTYTRRSGYWPSFTTHRGSLDELQGIALQIDYQQSSHGQPIAVWVLYLVSSAPAASVSVASFGSEQAAYARLALIAKALELPVIDRTGDRETTTPAAQFDQPLAATLSSGMSGDMFRGMSRGTSHTMAAPGFPSLPAAGRIRLAGIAPERRLALPPYGFNLGLALFLGWFGMIPLWMAYMGWHDKVTGRHPNTNLGFIAFVACVGLFFLLLIPAVSTFRTLIVESHADLSFGMLLFGVPLALKPIPKSAVEEIAVKPAPNLGSSRPLRPDLSKGFPQPQLSRHEVCIRSSARLVRIGSNLTPAEQEWLQQALTAMLGGA